MATDITPVLFIIVIDVAVIYLHVFVRGCLVLVMATGDNVYLINAANALIIY